MISSMPSHDASSPTASAAPQRPAGRATAAKTGQPDGQPQARPAGRRRITRKAESDMIRQQLEEAQALTHLGSWEWDVASGHIAWSDEMYRIYGLKPQERPIGFEEFMEMIHPDDRPAVQEIINE